MPCCSHSYGRRSAVPVTLGFLGAMLASFSVYHCSFISASKDGIDIMLGFFTHELVVIDDTFTSSSSSCVLWENEEKDAVFDNIWKLGKSMGTIAASLGFLAFILSVALCCRTVQPKQLKYLAGVYLLAALCSLTMLTGLTSEICNPDEFFECSLGPGAGTAMGAFCLLAGAGVSTLYLEKRDPAPDSEGSETVEDSNVKIIEVGESFATVKTDNRHTAKPHWVTRESEEGLIDVEL